MSDTQQAAAIAILRDAYPRQPFPDKSVAFYARKLAGIDGLELVAAVDRLTNRCTFLPSVAEIKREVAEARLELPNVAEAWEIAERGSLRLAPKPVRDATEFVGGRWAILHGDNPVAVRAQFREQYNALREQALLEEAGALPAQLDTPARGEQAALPPGVDFKTRPVMLRAIRAMTEQQLEPPTEEEIRDAIRIMEQGSIYDDAPYDDHLYRAAELVLVHANNAMKEEQ